MKSSTLLLVLLALASFVSGQILAQADGKGDPNKDPKTISVTGCLAQSDDPGVAKAIKLAVATGKMPPWFAAEVRPGTPSVVHHVVAFVRPPGSYWLNRLSPRQNAAHQDLEAFGPEE